jgi:hypothetical protein
MTHTVILWVTTIYTLVDGYQCFGEMYFLHYQGRSKGIMFPEKFAVAIFQTVEYHNTEYDQPKDLHRRENLKFYISLHSIGGCPSWFILCRQQPQFPYPFELLRQDQDVIGQ